MKKGYEFPINIMVIVFVLVALIGFGALFGGKIKTYTTNAFEELCKKIPGCKEVEVGLAECRPEIQKIVDEINNVYNNGGTKTGTVTLKDKNEYILIYTHTPCINDVGELTAAGCDTNYKVKFMAGPYCSPPPISPTGVCDFSSICNVQYDKKTGGLTKTYEIMKIDDTVSLGLKPSSLNPLDERIVYLMNNELYGVLFSRYIFHSSGTINLKSGQWVVLRNFVDNAGNKIVEAYTSIDASGTAKDFNNDLPLTYIYASNVVMNCDNENAPVTTWKNNKDICFMGGYSNDVSVSYSINNDESTGITTIKAGVYDPCLNNEKGGTDLKADSQCEFSEGEKCDSGSECSTGLCIEGICRSSCTGYENKMCSLNERIWSVTLNYEKCYSGTCKQPPEKQITTDYCFGACQAKGYTNGECSPCGILSTGITCTIGGYKYGYNINNCESGRTDIGEYDETGYLCAASFPNPTLTKSGTCCCK